MSKSIIIDPGHGGSDPGASAFGVLEKDWNLRISLYQYKRLKELGAKVAITRTTDTTLNSAPRTNKIRGKYDFCISNHWNAFNSLARGVETIHSINSNGQFARDLANALVETTGLPLRRVFTRKIENTNLDWYFMNRLTWPTDTTIIEYGFLDNILDYNWYKNDDNFYVAAEAVIKVICQYIGITYKPIASASNSSVPKVKQLQPYVGNEGWHKLAVGERVTIRAGAKRWVNKNFKQMEPMQKDYTGATDTIADVQDVKMGYSDQAYYLKRLKVWILQQDLVEPRLTPLVEAPEGKELLPYVGNANWHSIKAGEKVTIRKGHERWLNANFRQMEPKAEDYTGQTDIVSQVARVRTSYSDEAYYLETLKVWVLQQDLVEPRLTPIVPTVPEGKELLPYVGNEGWTKMEVGEEVTIRKGHKRWLNNNFKQMEWATEEYAGRTDTIEKVARVRTSYSDWAYYLKNMKVWVLEQDLVEPRE